MLPPRWRGRQLRSRTALPPAANKATRGSRGPRAGRGPEPAAPGPRFQTPAAPARPRAAAHRQPPPSNGRPPCPPRPPARAGPAHLLVALGARFGGHLHFLGSSCRHAPLLSSCGSSAVAPLLHRALPHSSRDPAVGARVRVRGAACGGRAGGAAAFPGNSPRHALYGG